MKIKLIIITFIAALILAACGENNNEENTSTNGETENIKELVNEYSANKEAEASASITSKELIVTDNDGNETTYELPEDEFFVSIAPYLTETHPCTNHSLTGCQGELANTEFDVYIKDEEGNVVVDEKITSLSNGFIDLWLPRDKKYQTTIEFDGKKVEGEISTFDEDGTCVTTLQLT